MELNTKALEQIRRLLAHGERELMEVNPKVLGQIKRFLHWARRYPVHKDIAWDDDDFAYSTECGRQYIYVRAGIFMFRVHAQSGQIAPNRGRRFNYCGNIAELTDGRDWRWGRIGCSSICVPINRGRPCNVCGRTDYVAKTTLGYRCRHCRGADSRHIGTVRRLGGVPIVNGRPNGRYYND